MSANAAKTWLANHDKPIPALDIYHKQALDLLNRKTSTLHDLANVITLDPGMSISLYDLINRKQLDKSRSAPASIHSALGLMGEEQIVSFVKKHPTLSQLEPKTNIRQAYFQLVSESYHRLLLTEHCIEMQGLSISDEIQGAAILHNIGEMLLCLNDFDKFSNHRFNVLQLQLLDKKAVAVFDFQIAQLSIVFATEKHLPELMIESQSRSESTGRKATTIQFAANISNQAEMSWSHPAMTKSLKACAEFLNIPSQKLGEQCLEIAIHAAGDFAIDDVFPAIARLISLPDISPPKSAATTVTKKAILEPASSSPKPRQKVTDPVQQKIEAKPMQKPPTQPIQAAKPTQKKPLAAPTTPVKPAPNPQLTLNNKIKKLVQSNDVNQSKIIGLLLNGLHQDLKFSRVVLILKNKNSLMTRFSKGLDAKSAFNKLSIKIGKSGVLQLLLSKPQAVWLHADAYKKCEPTLPGVFKACCLSDNFYLMSVFINGKAIGFVYCDQINSKSELNLSSYNEFKSSITLASKALDFISKRDAEKVS